MEIDRKLRVAHLVTHPIQYFAPLYRDLAQRPEIDLTVYFFSTASLNTHSELDFGQAITWDVPLTGGYHFVLCGDASRRPHDRRRPRVPNFGILKDIVRQRYDVIWLHGYANANAWAVTALGRLLGIPVFLRDDQTHLTPRSSVRRWAKQLVMPMLFKNVSGLFVGFANREFLRSYGTKRLYRMSHCVDNHFFQEQYSRLAGLSVSVRLKFDIEDANPVILFSGKFIDKKKPLLLLDAFQLVRGDVKCHLLLVGDGPLRKSIEETVVNKSIPDVHFAGFLNQSEISYAYAASDMLVLPSAYLETWGLVVNEAMNFGLSIVVSDKVGCAEDLVEVGGNGFVFRSGNVDELADAIRKLVLSSDLRQRFGRRSREMISEFSVERVADQFVEACFSEVKNLKLHTEVVG
jgi:glycosyltransferase involved in cell wall biosynthesis